MASESLADTPAHSLRSRSHTNLTYPANGAQHDGGFNPYGVFRVESLNDLNTVHRDGATMMESGILWPQTANTLSPELNTTMANDVHRETGSRRQETVQLPVNYHQVEDTGAHAGLELSTPSLTPFTPPRNVQHPIQNMMGHAMTNRGNTTTINGAPYTPHNHVAQLVQNVDPQFLAGPSALPNSSFVNNTISAHQPHSAGLNAYANGHTTPGIDIIGRDAEIRRLREENQSLWQIIRVLCERDRAPSRSSSST